MATTVITDETVTISLRMGATLAMAAIGDGTADIVYTLPGEAEQTDELAGTVERVYGPYPFGQDFAITATDSVQAVTTFGTITASATIQQVDSLPALGAPNVIYQTATAAYWWNGVAFIAMGSGAAGSFTTLAVSGDAEITGDLIAKTLSLTGQISTVEDESVFMDYEAAGRGRIGSPGPDADYSKPLVILNPLKIASQTPANASAPGVQWTFTADADYLYVCVATDTWKRVAIATWP